VGDKNVPAVQQSALSDAEEAVIQNVLCQKMVAIEILAT
jgi:hypothetical protein